MVPAVPPELMLLPNWFAINIYEMSSWTRGIVIPLAIVHKIQADGTIRFDQLIQEGTWVHISFDPQMRGQALTAHFVNGKATYTQGA